MRRDFIFHRRHRRRRPGRAGPSAHGYQRGAATQPPLQSRQSPQRAAHALHRGHRAGRDRKARVEFAPLQPGDVPETYADIEASTRDLGFLPRTGDSTFRGLVSGVSRSAIGIAAGYGELRQFAQCLHILLSRSGRRIIPRGAGLFLVLARALCDDSPSDGHTYVTDAAQNTHDPLEGFPTPGRSSARLYSDCAGANFVALCNLPRAGGFEFLKLGSGREAHGKTVLFHHPVRYRRSMRHRGSHSQDPGLPVAESSQRTLSARVAALSRDRDPAHLPRCALMAP